MGLDIIVTGFEELGELCSVEEDGLGWLCAFSNDSMSLRIVNPKGRPWETWWQAFTLRVVALNHALLEEHRSVESFGVLLEEQVGLLGLSGGPFPYLLTRKVARVEFPEESGQWREWMSTILQRMEHLGQVHGAGQIHGGLGANGLWDPVSSLRETLWAFDVKRADPRWFAPEQRAGGWCGSWTDVYGLGIALQRTVQRAKVKGTWPEWMWFEHWLKRCVAPEPDKRWRSMEDAKHGLMSAFGLREQIRRSGQYRPIVAAQKFRAGEVGRFRLRRPLDTERLGVQGDVLWRSLRRVLVDPVPRFAWLAGSALGQQERAQGFVSEAVATGSVLPLCFHVEQEGMMGAALGSMWARFWGLNEADTTSIKKVVGEEMIAWGLVDRADVSVMTQMVCRAVGVGAPPDLVVSADLHERQAVSIRLLQRISKAWPVLMWVREPQRTQEGISFVQQVKETSDLSVFVLVTSCRHEKSQNWSLFSHLWNGPNTCHVNCFPAEGREPWPAGPESEATEIERLLALRLDATIHMGRLRELNARLPGQLDDAASIRYLYSEGLITPLWGGNSEEWIFTDRSRVDALLAKACEEETARFTAASQNWVAQSWDSFSGARRVSAALVLGLNDRAVTELQALALASLSDADSVGAEYWIDKREAVLTEMRISATDHRWGQGWIIKGKCREMLSRSAEAQVWWRRALKAAHRFEWKEIEVEARWGLGRIERSIGNLDIALQQLQDSEVRAAELPESSVHRSVQLDLGWMCAEMGFHEDALQSLKSARLGFDALGDRLNSAACMVALAEVAKRKQRLELAKVLLRWAKTRYIAAGRRVGVTACLWRMGELSQLQGDLERALQYHREARDLFEKVGAPDWGVAELQMGIVLLEKGNFGDARERIEGILAHFDGRTENHWSGYGRACLLPCLAHHSDWEKWDDYLSSARFLIQKTALVEPNIARMAVKGGDIAMAMGEFDRAGDVFALAFHQFQSMGDDRGLDGIQRRRKMLMGG